jgi:hypothetical protein
MRIFLWLALALSGPAHAETTAFEFLSRYEGASDDGKRWLVGYVTGLVTGYGWANTTLKVKGQAQLYCMSDEDAVANEEVLGLVRKAIRKDRKVGHAPFGMAVLASLSRRFPCGTKRPAK